MKKTFGRLLNIEKIDEINKRYGRGNVELSPGGRLVLTLLKVYVIAMFVLLLVKFKDILTGGAL